MYCAGRAQSCFLTTPRAPKEPITRLALHLYPAPWILYPIAVPRLRICAYIYGFLSKVGGKIFVCSKLVGFCKSGRYVDQVPFWELTHVSQQDPHERTMSRFTLFWHDFTLFWHDFGTIAQTGTPRMSWRDRSQKVRHAFHIFFRGD